MKLSGAEIIIECLKEQKTDTIFGYPGGTVISVYDALYRRGDGIRHILTSHEQGAAHAADGYARSTGRTGVCLVTSGPGATNLVTGIATAYMDSVPIVAITINVSTAGLGKDSFQEVDIAGVSMPVTKHNFIVRDVNVLADTMRRAFSIASEGRPGPVLVDITRDVAEGFCEYESVSPESYAKERRRAGKAVPVCRDEMIARAASMIASSSRPVLLVGGGAAISGADEAVRSFAELTGCPVVDTLMGKGVYPGTGKLYLGMAGIYGDKAAGYALEQADLVIAVGCRFSERVMSHAGGELWATKGCGDDGSDDERRPAIIQIDIDRAEINKNVMVDAGICGDATEVLSRLNAELRTSMDLRKPLETAWHRELMKIRDEQEAGEQSDEERLTGVNTVQTIYELTGGDALVSCEVGLNQMYTARNYKFSGSRRFLTSGGLGTMGFGLGAAIGAAIGNPGSHVINIAGDGCFRMNMNELLTACRYKLPIIEVVLDNGRLGMVHDMQETLCDGRYCETEFNDNVDYAAIAAAMGAGSRSVSTKEELRKAFAEAESFSGPLVIVAKL